MGQQNKSRESVAFVINYLDESLLEMAKEFIPSGYKFYTIPGHGGYYGQKMFMDFCDKIQENFIINIDTDCFLTNHKGMWEVFDEFVEYGYALCGMPDGGVISHRCHNPLFINPFFSIWDLRQMRKMNLAAVNDVTAMARFSELLPRWVLKKNHPIASPQYKRLLTVFEDGLVPYGAANDFFEPYYAIQSAILNNGGKIMYMNADDAPEIDGDGACTKLYGLRDEVIALHSWFARSYTDGGEHFDRINKIYEHAKNCNTNTQGDSGAKSFR